MSLKKIVVIGGGSFGTALAQCFSKVSASVDVIEVNPQILKSVAELRENKVSLPNIKLNKNIFFSDSFEKIIEAELIFLVVPTRFIPDVCAKIKKSHVKTPVVLCSKGLDLNKNQLLSELLSTELDNPIFVLSGPSFAKEIAQGLPAKVNIAGKDFELCQKLAKNLSFGSFKIEAIEDLNGLQIAGALKNVLAIGCGILHGKNLGQSAMVRLIIQGIGEMITLSQSKTGKENTFVKIGALGDIILTCTNLQSRNMSFGKFIAEGGSISAWKGGLAEGIFTAKIFANQRSPSMDTFKKIHDVIYNKISVSEFLQTIFD